MSVQIWNTDNITVPELKFNPPDNWPPASGKYDTRDYYPLLDKETQAKLVRRLAKVVSRTEKRSTKYKLG